MALFMIQKSGDTDTTGCTLAIDGNSLEVVGIDDVDDVVCSMSNVKLWPEEAKEEAGSRATRL